MFSKPLEQHQWLDQLIGDWSFDHDCQMPDGSASTAKGTMTCRSLGGMWLISESKGETEEGNWSSIMTIGYDPVESRYIGTFVGSMMANIWHYQGNLDAERNRLPLECVGPSFDGTGTCHYRDTIAILDKDNWLFTSEMQDDNGEWVKFLDGKHRRI